MNSQFRSGDWVSTRSGLTWRMTRLMSRRSSTVRLDHAVGVPEEAHVADADDRGRGTLLVLAERRHVGPGHGAVRAAGVTVGGDAVGDLDAGRR